MKPKKFGIGQAVRRVEDQKFITGAGRYNTDALPADRLAAVFLRSPHANAAIAGIDTKAASAMPGVKLILTAADIGALKQLPCLAPMPNADGNEMAQPDYPLLARDRGFPTLSHQVLLRPMLDDRMRTHSSQMLDGEGVWDRNENAFGWAALLGRQSEVSPYAAPSRAVDLSGLPRTYLDTGSADTFRDETLEYAGRLSAHGVSVDLHVWGGGFHGFENQVPDAALSRICRTVQDEFIRRALAPARQA